MPTSNKNTADTQVHITSAISSLARTGREVNVASLIRSLKPLPGELDTDLNPIDAAMRLLNTKPMISSFLRDLLSNTEKEEPKIGNPTEKVAGLVCARVLFVLKKDRCPAYKEWTAALDEFKSQYCPSKKA